MSEEENMSMEDDFGEDNEIEYGGDPTGLAPPAVEAQPREGDGGSGGDVRSGVGVGASASKPVSSAVPASPEVISEGGWRPPRVGEILAMWNTRDQRESNMSAPLPAVAVVVYGKRGSEPQLVTVCGYNISGQPVPHQRLRFIGYGERVPEGQMKPYVTLMEV